MNPALRNVSTQAILRELRARLERHRQGTDRALAKVGGLPYPEPTITEKDARTTRSTNKKLPLWTPSTRGRPHAPTSSTHEHIVEALRRIGRPAGTREIVNEMVTAGWSSRSDDPMNVVSAALSALVKRGDVARIKRGRFGLRAGTLAPT